MVRRTLMAECSSLFMFLAWRQVAGTIHESEERRRRKNDESDVTWTIVGISSKWCQYRLSPPRCATDAAPFLRFIPPPPLLLSLLYLTIKHYDIAGGPTGQLTKLAGLRCAHLLWWHTSVSIRSKPKQQTERDEVTNVIKITVVNVD